MAKNPRRERRAADPAQPPLTQIGALLPRTMVAFIAVTGEVTIFLGDNRTGLSIDENNPLATINMRPIGYFFRIEFGPIGTFDNIISESNNSITLIKNDAGWSVNDTIAVWSPGWHTDVRGAKALHLAPFMMTAVLEP